MIQLDGSTNLFEAGYAFGMANQLAIWTQDKPTLPGFYWYYDGAQLFIVEVRPGFKSMCEDSFIVHFHGDEVGDCINDLPGLWLSDPIMPPETPK